MPLIQQREKERESAIRERSSYHRETVLNDHGVGSFYGVAFVELHDVKQMIIKDQTVTRLGSHNTSSRPGHRYNREREVTDVPKRSRQELTSRLKPLAPPLSQLYKIKDNMGGYTVGQDRGQDDVTT